MQPNFSIEKFIRVWQSSAYIDEVMRITKQSYRTVYHRARRLREAGVPLKRLTRESPRNRLNPQRIKQLKQIAKDALGG